MQMISTSKTLLFILLLNGFLTTEVVGQFAMDSTLTVSGQVIDGESDEPIAFAILLQQGTDNGAFTDIDGRFQLTLNAAFPMLTVQYMGYHTVELNISSVPKTIKLYPNHFTLQEVVIRPGINPAERIIYTAIAHKEQNNPEKNFGFTYESYNRLAFGAQLDSTLLHSPDSLAKCDTSTQEIYNFFDQQYLFLLETVAKRKFLPPNYSEERIIANRVSGLKNSDLFALATQLQSFSFYDNEVTLMSQRYLSPLADASPKKYLFILENTAILGGDTVWTISYRPRKNKNFDGMEGVMFINSNGYAIQQVTATPKSNSAQSIKILQQYQFIDNKQWFPIQLNSILVLPGMLLNNLPMIGDGKSYIRNIQLDPPLQSRDFGPVLLYMDKNAGLANDSIWRTHRMDSLSQKDLKTYDVIDSLGRVMHLDKKVKMMESLLAGKIKMGVLDLDLNRLMSFNNFEGFRAGIGLHTNDDLIRNLAIGGYYGYGFRDKGHKYGGDIAVHLNKKRGIKFEVFYSNDVAETGGNLLEKSQAGLIKSTYPLFINRMDRRETKTIQFSGRWWSNLSGSIGVSQQYIQSFEGYQWYNLASDQLTYSRSAFDILEGQLSLRWAPGEKLLRLGQREIAVGGKWPIFMCRFAKSLDGSPWSNLQYTRVDVNLSKVLYILNVGETTFQLFGGRLIGDNPAPLLYNARGTYNKFTIAVPYSFETMRTNEFMHDEFVSLHVRHNFKHLLFRRPNFEPQLVASHSSLYGRLSNVHLHSTAFKSAQLGYHESGLSINGLFKSNFSNLGIGVFYRYGPYHLSGFRSNVAFKITSNFQF